MCNILDLCSTVGLTIGRLSHCSFKFAHCDSFCQHRSQMFLEQQISMIEWFIKGSCDNEDWSNSCWIFSINDFDLYYSDLNELNRSSKSRHLPFDAHHLAERCYLLLRNILLVICWQNKHCKLSEILEFFFLGLGAFLNTETVWSSHLHLKQKNRSHHWV